MACNKRVDHSALGCLLPAEIVYGRNKGVCMGFFPMKNDNEFSILLFFVPFPHFLLPLSADDYATVPRSQLIQFNDRDERLCQYHDQLLLVRSWYVVEGVNDTLLICSWYVLDMFLTCSWYVLDNWYILDIFLICSWYVLDMFLVCSWYILYTSLTCAWYVRDMFLICLWYVLDMFLICAWYVLDIFLICSLCSWYICDMFLICSWLSSSIWYVFSCFFFSILVFKIVHPTCYHWYRTSYYSRFS